MSTHRESRRNLKAQVFDLLRSDDFDQAMNALGRLPARQTINALFSFLLSTDPAIKWTAVTAMGSVVAKLADHQTEQARVIMRRLMWQLNDESGGIGWGCPETMGEIMACHEGLAKEFAHILISYVRKGGNFLEYEPLLRGAVWGIARVAQVRPHLVREGIPHLLPFLKSSDTTLRGLTAWALGLLSSQEARSNIEALVHDSAEVEIYQNHEFTQRPVKDLAEQALGRLKGDRQ